MQLFKMAVSAKLNIRYTTKLHFKSLPEPRYPRFPVIYISQPIELGLFEDGADRENTFKPLLLQILGLAMFLMSSSLKECHQMTIVWN